MVGYCLVKLNEIPLSSAECIRDGIVFVSCIVAFSNNVLNNFEFSLYVCVYVGLSAVGMHAVDFVDDN